MSSSPTSPTVIDPRLEHPSRRVTWRRLRTPLATLAIVFSALHAVGQALVTVAVGSLVENAAVSLVVLLAVMALGSALFDIMGRILWSTSVDRAEGELRGDLLTAAMQQPVAVLTEQAVGEVLDRVDDDTHEIGALCRDMLWMMLGSLLMVPALYVVAVIAWWPAAILYPLVAGLAWWTARPYLPQIAERKVLEEMAWTDHAAALEEGIAARDDLRTSLGQAHVIRRLSQLTAAVHRHFLSVVRLEAKVGIRLGVVLHSLVIAVAVVGVLMATSEQLSISRLVTVFLATSLFVGQVEQIAERIPDLQAGLGAVVRLRQLLDSPPEPEGGRPVPDGPLPLEFRNLHFAYTQGGFALRGVQLEVPAGETCALVGRTGSGKSTLASLVSRTVEPEPGTVFLGGVDVLELDLHLLRSTVGVVTQRTEIIAGTLADNITLFNDQARPWVDDAIAELGLSAWVAGLPDGIDTLLGPGGTTLSAGEEQLVAFARLLVRDVRVVILDEATARMDPLTEARVVAAADRLVSGRTGVLVAHRLSTTQRAQQVSVLHHGEVIQQGRRADLATAPGPFADLLAASDSSLDSTPDEPTDGTDDGANDGANELGSIGGVRRTGAPPERAQPGEGPGLAHGILRAICSTPRWGLASIPLFWLATVGGSLGALTGYLWGQLVERLSAEPDFTTATGWLLVALSTCMVMGPILLSRTFLLYPRWWIDIMLRVRFNVLVGQTDQRRLPRTPPGEVVSRAMDCDRFTRYADRWVDVFIGIITVIATGLLGGTVIASLVLVSILGGSAIASVIGRPIAGRSATAASQARANFGRAVVSALDTIRTVKLAAATEPVHRHLQETDTGRVEAAVREHRVAAVLTGIPVLMVQAGVVATWAIYASGGWSLGTALLVNAAASSFGYFGQVAGWVITEAPGTRAWQLETQRFAGGVDLVQLPDDVDLVAGKAPTPVPAAKKDLHRMELRGYCAVHDDGTIGVSDIDLDISRGELVLLLGQVGSGKSSLMASLAGLVSHRGDLRWNGEQVEDPEEFLRPGQVSYVAQVPRVLSGSFSDNIRLDHDRAMESAVDDARLHEDIADAGGPDAVVGHRGVRLSGGQVQRLALARALAADASLLLADDVSSALDASTEIELWQALRARGTTVLGATSKRAALQQADRVVVLIDGKLADQGPWSQLSGRWAHLAS